MSSAPRSRAHQVENAILAALDRLPETFDRFELIRVLGFEPRRSTLLRLLKLLVEDETLEIESYGSGPVPTVYRKPSPPA